MQNSPLPFIKVAAGLILFFALSLSSGAQAPWQQFSDKKTSEILKEFAAPPAAYGMILWWGWDGPVNDTVIRRDLDRIKSQGFTGVMIEAGYGMEAKYLSKEWFELVRTGVAEAKKRGMKVWIEDEGKYPSGFAGGKFSQERPDLKMQGLVATGRVELEPGKAYNGLVAPGSLSAIALNINDNSIEQIGITNGQITWPGREGTWRIVTAGNRFRSSQTRSVNNPSRGKDTTASLMDYLNPAATRQFLDWTHEQYRKYIGDEFGKTFMGFMGDEPDFAYTPFTPEIIKVFREKKGYDITPYLAAFTLRETLPEEYKRAKADYWDVWSDLFRDNFFTVQADWCRKNNIEYIVHLNHEDQLQGLVRSSGDFFKNMRHVAVPGVDAIWSQIWMDHTADYPKLASSAAHLFGKPRAFTESFAAYSYRPTVPQAKWVLDYQLVRGINSIQVMFMSASAGKPAPANPARPARTSFFLSDTFPPVAAYMNRASYLLSQGRPACRTGLYCPAPAMWLSDQGANRNLLAAAQQLLENQLDFDFIDDQALSEVLTAGKGSLRNLSGQEYTTIIVPEISIIPSASFEKLKLLATSGGNVIFLGKSPLLVYDKNILTARHLQSPSWGKIEVSGTITRELINDPDFTIKGRICPPVKYQHRKLADGDLWFIFNESDSEQLLTISLEGRGKTEEWDAFTGKSKKIKPLSVSGGMIELETKLLPRETRFYVVRK